MRSNNYLSARGISTSEDITTITAKALIRKGVCQVKLCDVEGSMCDCVGVLVMGGEFE